MDDNSGVVLQNLIEREFPYEFEDCKLKVFSAESLCIIFGLFSPVSNVVTKLFSDMLKSDLHSHINLQNRYKTVGVTLFLLI